MSRIIGYPPVRRNWPLLAGRVVEAAMARPEETLRWQFLLDEDRWESRTETADLLNGQTDFVENPGDRMRSARLWALTVAALFLAGAASLLWLWRDAQAGLNLVRDELNAAIALEIWAEERGDRAMASSLLDEYADESWRNQIVTRFFPLADGTPRQISVQIDDFDLKEGRALVQVIVSDNRLATPYQETRVYRETTSGWIRSAPGADFWGAWESQESAYFSFRYRKRDRGAVTAAALQLDLLYEQIYRSVGLSVDPEGEKMQVELRISGPFSRGSTRTASGRVLVVPSPELLPRPLSLSTERLLVESVIQQAINLVIWERMERIPGDWQSIRSGLRLWLIWKVDGLLAQSRPEIVRWLYSESMAERRRGDTRRPENYTHICQNFWLWQLHPYEIGIPLTCDQTEGQIFTPVRMPVAVRQLPMPEMDPELRGSWTRLNTGRAIAVATVFEYLEKSYGPASVSELLAQTRIHLRWQKLITDSIGITPAEFEAGWLAHVRTLAEIQ
ncbi:MAG: hypothetical protein HY328_04805 [Chloroflexi bacterium]|nr:hypothetical protein [Chloroflexota bacterium]